MSDLHQQIQFIIELDKLKAIKRKALIKADQNRYENSAEHSWHIALAAHILAPYAEEAIQIGRVCQMLLIHDVVEIDAGDAFAFAHNEVLGQQSEKRPPLLHNACLDFYQNRKAVTISSSGTNSNWQKQPMLVTPKPLTASCL